MFSSGKSRFGWTRSLRRIWNPSLVKHETEYRELERRYEQLKASYDQFKASCERAAKADRSAAEECRRRIELLLFESRNHIAHLMARLGDPVPAGSQDKAAMLDQAADAVSTLGTLEHCRGQLDELIAYSRSGFARSNDLLDKFLRTEEPGRLETSDHNFNITMVGLKPNPEAHGDALFEVDMTLPPSHIRCVEDFAEIVARVAPIHLTEQQRFLLAERLAWAAYPKYRFSDYSRLYLEDRAFVEIYKETADAGNWHSLDRKYLVNEMLKFVEHLPGDFVECGVWKGSTAVWLCRAAERQQRRVHLFDSWEGLSAPTPHLDGTYWREGGLAVPMAKAEEYLRPYASAIFYRGWIPDRFSEVSSTKVSFLHIDVDLFNPTRDSIAYFYPRVVPGGIIICDDYGTATCPGAKKAMDDFFEDKPEKIALLPTGQGFVIKQ